MRDIPLLPPVIGEARAAKKQGIHMVAVGVGGWLDVYELNAIASYPSNTNIIEIPDIDDLPFWKDTLEVLVCNSKCHWFMPTTRSCMNHTIVYNGNSV